MKRAVWLTAVLLLAAEAAPVRADMPGPFPSPSRNRRVPPLPTPVPETNAGTPPPPPPPTDPGTGKPVWEIREENPSRTGPFRSCGTGAPLALAGIAATWGMLWLGNRVAGRVSRRESR